LGKLRYGSDIVNVVADARLEHGPGLGTFGYDDEGVPRNARDHYRWTVHRLPVEPRNRRVHRPPAFRRHDAHGILESLPIIRMTNISILPGTWRYEDLIADTDDAILMETNRSWSIDDKRYHFQFSTEIAWEIKGGKKTRMLKHPSYSGITTEFWIVATPSVARALDPLGYAQLRQGSAYADHGHRARSFARAFPECQIGRRNSQSRERC